jgi:hypothetical protein
MNMFVKNKLAAISETSCRTCSSALVFIGHSKSEQMTVCTYVHPNIVVPFAVHSCSGYYDKNQPRKQMQGFKAAVNVDIGND